MNCPKCDKPMLYHSSSKKEHLTFQGVREIEHSAWWGCPGCRICREVKHKPKLINADCPTCKGTGKIKIEVEK